MSVGAALLLGAMLLCIGGGMTVGGSSMIAIALTVAASALTGGLMYIVGRMDECHDC